MIDLNRPIYLLLNGIAAVELEFPDTKASFPVITITEVSNVNSLTVGEKEALSDITYQIDVWDNEQTRQRCERIAAKVNEVMTKNHFTRTMGRGFRDPGSGLHRKTMYFNGKFINLYEER